MQTTVRLEEIKTKILDVINQKGPSLPVHLTSAIERDTMFVGAILSELLASKKIKVSHAKIGGSRVYYVPGQEERLTLLYDHLPMKEKEAYNIIKEKSNIKHLELDPSIRVALNNLKDFAVPYRKGNDIYWRWYLTPQKKEISIKKPLPPKKQEEKKETKQDTQEQLKQKQEEQPSPFLDQVKTFITSKQIQVNETESARKNREYVYSITLQSSMGNLPMLLIAKNKKRLNENDLVVAHNLAQAKKLPAILLTTGTFTKKALEYKEKHLKGLLHIHTI